MMGLVKVQALIIFLILCSCRLKAQDTRAGIKQVSLENTEQFSIRSKYVKGENYVIQVSLPVNYNSYDYSFPVIYVLDGDKSFGMTKEIANWLMWFSEIRDIIVVGISYGQGTDSWWEKRERDYTHCTDTINARGSVKNSGGAENFLRFIREELMPAVNKKYRTRQDSNALMGISYGGMLCSYVLFSRPEMFNGYIIIGPTLIWNNKSILKLETEYSNFHKVLHKKVYIAYGTLDNKSWVINPADEFINEIRQHNFEGLKLVSEELEGETHISAYATAVTHGLKILFKR